MCFFVILFLPTMFIVRDEERKALTVGNVFYSHPPTIFKIWLKNKFSRVDADGVVAIRIGPCLLPNFFSRNANNFAIWPFGSKRTRKNLALYSAGQNRLAEPKFPRLPASSELNKALYTLHTARSANPNPSLILAPSRTAHRPPSSSPPSGCFTRLS